MTVLVIGPSSWNQIVHLDALPRPEPHTVFATGTVDTLGGTSAGKALHLRDLGVDAHLHTVVGTDDAAGRITGALQRAGVSFTADVVDGTSERHLNLMDTAGGRVSVYLTTTSLPSPSDDAALLDRVRSAHAVVLDLCERARALVEDIRDCGVPIWTDLHDYDGVADFHRPFLDAADYVFCNADALGDPLPFLHRVVSGGARAAVCTLGARGAVAVDAQHVEHHVEAAACERIVDTNGAGDGFLAGFLRATLGPSALCPAAREAVAPGLGVPDVAGLSPAGPGLPARGAEGAYPDTTGSHDDLGAGADVRRALRAGARQALRALGTRHLSPLLDA